MAIRRVTLVFGPKTRVVLLRADAGRVNREIIGREMKPGERLLGVIGHYPGKLTPANVSKILRMRVDAVAIAGGAKIAIPEMINVPGSSFSVMKGVVAGGQLAALVKTGYEIKGRGSATLKRIIADESNAGKGIGYMSLLAGRALAAELNRQNPGRKFRVPFNSELITLNEQVGEQLSDREFWIWTETEDRGYLFVLRHLLEICRFNDYRAIHYSRNAVRLVEDLI